MTSAKGSKTMRISKLSERADLPVGTVKFYLRSGLLHPGLATGATQARYDETHLLRLRTIRALLEVGGLSLAEIQRVLDAVDHPGRDEAGSADDLDRIDRIVAAEPTQQVDLAPAREAITALGWHVAPDSPHLAALAQALAALGAIGLEVDHGRLKACAEAAAHVARHDVEASRKLPPGERPAHLALGTILTDPLMSALRRLAREHHERVARSRVPGQRVALPNG
ncbi:MerR family transcriptional regulator [Nocardioides sp. AE5]|uniref:MerR family transcriptional regulator n=1 Tax=Nocardioides sp. AE5 TaxID=2962573 RepID=UPI0028828A62|nr:MerR family transcriptional regulator [Nocardioides sp. AE5]MDT0202866.1 MerR family transcriptional regulator [Nocardioides sp. AE5]